MVLKSLDFKEPKTHEGAKLLANLKLESALIVDSFENKNLILSMRNIPGVKAIDFSQVNVFDVLKYRDLVFSERGFDMLMERLK